MKDDLNYIDTFYKERLRGYTVESETDTWGKMKWRLFWLRYKWILSGGASALLLSAAFLALYTNHKTYENTVIAEKSVGKTELLYVSASEPNSIVNSKETASEPNKKTNSWAQRNNENHISNSMRESRIATHAANLKKHSSEEAQVEENIIHEDGFLDKGFMINELSSNNINYGLSVLPDSLLMGSNRRTDVLPPGIKNIWFSANIYGGASYCVSSLSGNNTEYINLRNDNETNSPAYSLGGDLRFHYKNFVITTGLNYSVYNQNRHYKKSYQEYSPEESYYKYDTTWVWVYDPPDFGKPVVSDIDSSWTEVYKTIVIDNSGVNRVEYLEIPIMFGYRFNKNLFTIEINAGASAGFFVYSDFKAPSFTDYDEIDKIGQINNTMFNFIANASVYYHLNNKTSVFVSPYYKKNLSPIFRDSYPVNQKFRTFGLNFGLNFRF
jgi:hypothetical protein